MQGLVGETCFFRDVKLDSSFTCIQKDNSEAKRVLSAKSQCPGRLQIRAVWVVRFVPKLVLDVDKVSRAEKKLPLLLSNLYQDFCCFPIWRSSFPVRVEELSHGCCPAAHRPCMGQQGWSELPQHQQSVSPSHHHLVTWEKWQSSVGLCVLFSSPVFSPVSEMQG